jgi:hypothetical protein
MRKFSDAEKRIYDELPAGDDVLTRLRMPEDVINDPLVSGYYCYDESGVRHDRLTIASLLEKISVGDFFLYSERDRTLSNMMREENQLEAMNKLTACRERMNIGCDIRPRKEWVPNV